MPPTPRRKLCAGQIRTPIVNSSPREEYIEGPCAVTGETYRVRAYTVDIEAWLLKELAQYAFPYLTTEQREFLISGTSPAGHRKVFGD